jgi:hypothetical protein
VHFSSYIPKTPDKAYRGRMSKKAKIIKRNALVRNQERKYMSDLRVSFEEQS